MANCTCGTRRQNASKVHQSQKICTPTLQNNAKFTAQRYTRDMKMPKILLLSALASVCVVAHAQWQWIDNEGHKVFSDRAPPSDIPDKNVLKRPFGRATVAVEADAAPAPAAGQTSDNKAAGIDKDLEAKKKQAAEAEAAKRKAEEERYAKAKIENCARAKQAKASFDSGLRISRTNAAGEREFMDDAARASELKRIQGIIASDCK